MQKIHGEITNEDLREEYKKLIKKFSDEELKDILAFLLWDPDVIIKRAGTDNLEECENHYGVEYRGRYLGFSMVDKEKCEKINNILNNEFNVFLNDLPEAGSDPYGFFLGEIVSLFSRIPLLRELIKETIDLRLSGKSLPDDLIIKQIDCFTSKNFGKEYDIVINEDYLNPLRVSAKKRVWRLFFELVEQGFIISKNDGKYITDYFNHNEGSLIAKNTKYPNQVIIIQKNDTYKLNFKGCVYSNKVLVQKQNKLKT